MDFLKYQLNIFIFITCLCILCSRIRVWVLCLSLRNAIFCFVFLWADHVSTANHQLVMAPRRAKRGKSKVAFKLEVVFDQLRFHTHTNEQTFETLIKDRRIWGERKINLHELHLLSVRIYSLGIGCLYVQTYNPLQLTWLKKSIRISRCMRISMVTQWHRAYVMYRLQ